MLSIRLSRVGKKKQPTYRVIVCDKKKDPWGKYLENLGHYNPRSNPKEIVLKADRIQYWLSVGAQASATVHNLLVSQHVVEAGKVRASKSKKKKGEEKKEGDEEKGAAATENKEEKGVGSDEKETDLGDKKKEEKKDKKKPDEGKVEEATKNGEGDTAEKGEKESV